LEGPDAFEKESQHNIEGDEPEALLTTEILDKTRVFSAPDSFIKTGVGVDPSGGAGQCGIVAGGVSRINKVNHSFVLFDNSTPLGTESRVWAVEVLVTYRAIDADAVYVERNFGGDLARTTIQSTKLVRPYGEEMIRGLEPDDIVFENDLAASHYTGERTAVVLILDGAKVNIVEVQATRGKAVRAAPVATLYQQGLAHHVGTHPKLQGQWTRWIPGTMPSPDRLDAEVWLQHGLGMVISGADTKKVARARGG
jgi:phage terminase large subunit-like protein